MADLELHYEKIADCYERYVRAAHDMESNLSDALQLIQANQEYFLGSAASSFDKFHKEVVTQENLMHEDIVQGARNLDEMAHNQHYADLAAAQGFAQHN